MLEQLKKYLKLKAEAMKKMQTGDLEGYLGTLREIYELRTILPKHAPVPTR